MKWLIDDTDEKIVLGSMLTSDDVADMGLSLLTKEDFQTIELKNAYEFIKITRTNNLPIEGEILRDIDSNRKHANLFTFSLPSNLFEIYADRVRKKTAARLMANQTAILADSVNDSNSISEYFEETEKIIGSLGSLKPESKQGLKSAKNIKLLKADEERIKFGFRTLDQKLNGLAKGQVCVIAARTSVGKTALALNIARNVSKSNYGVLIFSLEMTSEELIKRIYANEADLNSIDVYDDNPAILKARKEIEQWPLYIDDSSKVSIDQLAARARSISKQKDIKLIIIDYIQLLGGDRKRERHLEVAEISRQIKALAKELSLPIIILAQLNRLAISSEEPDLHHLRESDSIGQDADVILILYRKPDAQPGTRIPIMIKIAKSRDGATDTIEMMYDAPRLRFLEKARY